MSSGLTSSCILSQTQLGSSIAESSEAICACGLSCDFEHILYYCKAFNV